MHMYTEDIRAVFFFIVIILHSENEVEMLTMDVTFPHHSPSELVLESRKLHVGNKY